MKKRFVKLVVLIAFLPVVYCLVTVLYGSFTNYSPEEKIYLSNMEEYFFMNDTVEYSALIWNIGYGGLGVEMDFFYDGGKKVQDTEENTNRNLFHIYQFLQNNDSIDFILLQELDVNSKRSYKINQFDILNISMSSHFMFQALNYKVNYVPVPFLKPMGEVNSGLVNMTIPVPKETVRYSLPGDYSWPKNIFMLDRCLLVSRYVFENKKEFVLINVHNSTCDDGSLRMQETLYIKNFVQNEYRKGNYVLVAGDWNQCPPDFNPQFQGCLFDTLRLSYIASDFMPADWKWVYDNTNPTNRRGDIPYDKNKTLVTLIDFFLASPNIEVLSCKSISTEFKYSDHNPVIMRFKFQ